MYIYIHSHTYIYSPIYPYIYPESTVSKMSKQLYINEKRPAFWINSNHRSLLQKSPINGKRPAFWINSAHLRKTPSHTCANTLQQNATRCNRLQQTATISRTCANRLADVIQKAVQPIASGVSFLQSPISIDDLVL